MKKLEVLTLTFLKVGNSFIRKHELQIGALKKSSITKRQQ